MVYQQLFLTLLTNAASIFLAAFAGYWIADKVRSREFVRHQRLELLRTLIAYRGDHRDIEFRKAMNSIVFLYPKDEELKTLVKKIWQGSAGVEEQGKQVVELIHRVADQEGFHLTQSEINNFFEAPGSSVEK